MENISARDLTYWSYLSFRKYLTSQKKSCSFDDSFNIYLTNWKILGGRAACRNSTQKKTAMISLCKIIVEEMQQV